MFLILQPVTMLHARFYQFSNGLIASFLCLFFVCFLVRYYWQFATDTPPYVLLYISYCARPLIVFCMSFFPHSPIHGRTVHYCCIRHICAFSIRFSWQQSEQKNYLNLTVYQYHDGTYRHARVLLVLWWISTFIAFSNKTHLKTWVDIRRLFV